MFNKVVGNLLDTVGLLPDFVLCFYRESFLEFCPANFTQTHIIIAGETFLSLCVANFITRVAILYI